jgi:hypothetical protein
LQDTPRRKKGGVTAVRKDVTHQRVTTVFFFTILFISFVSTVNSWRAQITSGPFDANQSGDWLLNYSGGFVRRGLTGQLFETFVPGNVSIIAAVGIFQILLLTTLYILISILFMRSSRTTAILMLCLSPAFLLFPAINVEGAFRKEVMALVSLAVLAIGVYKGISRPILITSLAIYTLAVFSHEATIAVLPGLLLLIHRYLPAAKFFSAKIVNGYLIGVSVTAGLLALLFPGNSEQVAAICESWAARGIGPCDQGALATLTVSTGESVEFLIANYFPDYLAYGVVIALAVIPLFLVRFLPTHWKFSVIVLIFLAPLFFVAWDYGRWIYIGIAQLSIVALAMEGRKDLPRPYSVPLLVGLGYVLLWGFSWYEQVWRDGVVVQLLQQLGIVS